MVGPSEEFRAEVWARAEEVDSEGALSELLHDINTALTQDVAPSEGLAPDPEEELAAADSWASVASYAMGRWSAPASPWPRRKKEAGWGVHAVDRLRAIARTLSEALRRVMGQLGATSFSIGVSFPWGIQISLSW